MTTSPDEERFLFFFLIGTENVKQNHIILNENTTVLKWRQLMRNKWADASERTRDCSDHLQLLWEVGGVSMHLTLMFQLCIAQSQNQTGHEIEEVARDSSHFTPEESSDEHKEMQQHDTVIGLSWHKKIKQLASDFWLYWESCTSSQTKQSLCNTRDRHNKITTKHSEAETPYTSILGVLRDPQCEVRHRISLSVSKNKVLTAKKSQMAGLPFFSPLFLSPMKNNV